MSLCAEDLLHLELFQSLPKQRLSWICARAEEIALKQGEVLFREGDLLSAFLVLIAGRIGMTHKSEGVEMPIGQHEAPGFFGEIPALTDEPVLVTFWALTDCRLYRISGEDLRELLHECRDFERTLFQAIHRRMRGLESFIQNREKMAALGTLAAGLAHELNNPAAALVRSLKNIPDALLELQRMSLLYGQRNVDEAQTQQWMKARDEGYDAIRNHLHDPTMTSDHEDRLLDWLENYGVKDAWRLAEPLAAAGIEVETLADLIAPWRNDPTELRDMGLRWLALSFDVMSMVTGGLRGAERIAELVQSMKSYSYLDQGSQQIIDIHEGLEDTLRLFSYKLKQGIEIRRIYDRTLPSILAFGSELNQVWTNLIDNAIDAMDETGVLEIVTSQNNDHIQVQITDSGQGLSPDVRSRIFEPFFTTKPVGKGSGLGLDVARRIVENRHQGALLVDSQPGKTTFTVYLPFKSQRMPSFQA